MAQPRAVTFDFHDTIAIAPAWFALEVHQLPGMVLHTLAERGVFPHDGALMARATDPYRALRRAVQEHGQEADALAGVQHALRAIGVEVADDLVTAAIDDLMASVRASAAPRPGIIEAVTDLAMTGVPMAVISNAVYHPFIEWCLEDWGLSEAFASIVSSARCGYYKSHPGIYHCALESLSVGAGEAVHIGDSYPYDILAPHALGMRTVWLHLHGERPEPCVADLVVRDLDDLAAKILDLPGHHLT